MWGITGGDVVGIGGSIAGTMLSNSASKNESRRNRRFQAVMAKNAHQFEVKDLIAAGLNPILSAGGSGAKASGGAQASIADLGASVSKGVTTALAAKTLKAELPAKRSASAIAEMEEEQRRKQYDFLAKNPRFADAYYAGRLAREAGMNSDIWGPFAGTTSAKTRSRVKDLFDKYIGDSWQKWYYGRENEELRNWKVGEERPMGPVKPGRLLDLFPPVNPQDKKRRKKER